MKHRDQYVEGFKAGALLGFTAASIAFAIFVLFEWGVL